jgi:prefoldin subunit 5
MHVALTLFRVKDLEKQVDELESESQRLSQALDAQSATNSGLEVSLRKKTDESARDVYNKVSPLFAL